jgi:hypothetical protein
METYFQRLLRCRPSGTSSDIRLVPTAVTTSTTTVLFRPKLMLFASASRGLAAAARVIATTGVPPHKENKSRCRTDEK